MDAPSLSSVTPCRTCGGPTIGWGRDKDGNSRRKCKACRKTFGIIPERPLGNLRLDMEKATLCLSLLTEGSSIRSTERITGVHRDTIMRLLRKAGAKCEALMNRIVSHVPVADVQADELWCFVGMKEKTKKLKKIDNPELGDAYTFVGLERESKLALAFHMGRRTMEDASIFSAKLAAATEGRFQISTDGFSTYPAAIEEHFGGRVDYGQIVKVFGTELIDERRYSPPAIISAEKVVISGAPKEERLQMWVDARDFIMEVLREAKEGLRDSEAVESNGNSCCFRYEGHELRFSYNKVSRKINRSEYLKAGKREYDMDAIDRAAIEAELREFVRAVAAD